MPKELFQHLVKSKELHGHHFWGCDGCSKGVYEFTVQVQKLKLELNGVKKQVEENTSTITTVKDKVENLEKLVEEGRVDRTKDKEDIVSAAKSSWSAELRDREARRGNIVVHNLPEPPADLTVAARRKEKDLAAFKSLLTDIGINADIDEDIKFSVRPGKAGDRPKARPLIVGFRNKDLRDRVLDSAKKLKQSHLFSNVSIVPDLTAQQRHEDKELQQEADRLNGELEAEGVLNYQYRCQGRKGERILVKGKVSETRPASRHTTGANSIPLGTTRGAAALQEKPSSGTSEDSETDSEEESEADTVVEGEAEAMGTEETEAVASSTKRKAIDSPPTQTNRKENKKKKKEKNPS